MRNLSNRPYDGTLEMAVAHVENEYAAGIASYVKYSGYEVESYCPREPEERRTLVPQFDDPAGVGEIVNCSGLGLTRQWRVVAVAVGYPGRIRIMQDEMTTGQVVHLLAGRNETDPQGLYMLTMERGELPQLYDRLVQKGFQPQASSEAAPEIEVLRISGTISELRREIHDALGTDGRHVHTMHGVGAPNVLHIDVEVPA